MHIPTATVQDGQLILNQPIPWPDGTVVQLNPQPDKPSSRFTQEELDSFRSAWGEEPFVRPEQGVTDTYLSHTLR